MIHIVNKRTHTPTPFDYYIGRGAALGNIFSHLPHSKAEYKVDTIDQAVKEYSAWFYDQIENGNPKIKRAIDEIYEIINCHKSVNLVCYCWPKKCHGEIIRSFLVRKACTTCMMFSLNECIDPSNCFTPPALVSELKAMPTQLIIPY